MAEKGVAPALCELDAAHGMINTGVDVVMAETLKEYEDALDARSIPHEWTARGWNAPTPFSILTRPCGRACCQKKTGWQPAQ